MTKILKFLNKLVLSNCYCFFYVESCWTHVCSKKKLCYTGLLFQTCIMYRIRPFCSVNHLVILFDATSRYYMTHLQFISFENEKFYYDVIDNIFISDGTLVENLIAYTIITALDGMTTSLKAVVKVYVHIYWSVGQRNVFNQNYQIPLL